MGEKDDFVSLWKKKGESSQPSAVGGLLDKVNAKTAEVDGLTKQNEELKDKILKNIELLNQTETVITTLKDKLSDLEEEKRNSAEKFQMQVNELKVDLEKAIKNLTEAGRLIEEKDSQILDLKEKITQESAGPSEPDDLASTEAKLKEVTGINRELMEKIKTLDSEVISLKKPEPKEMPKGPFNMLVDDLQKRLNKSKKQIQTLITENKTLKGGKAPEGGGDSEKITKLESENAELLERISKLETKEGSVDASLIQDLENKINEKDNIIEQLKSGASTAAPSGAPGAASSGLAADLQKKIQKLRTEIKKKDKIIADLKK